MLWRALLKSGARCRLWVTIAWQSSYPTAENVLSRRSRLAPPNAPSDSHSRGPLLHLAQEMTTECPQTCSKSERRRHDARAAPAAARLLATWSLVQAQVDGARNTRMIAGTVVASCTAARRGGSLG